LKIIIRKAFYLFVAKIKRVYNRSQQEERKE